MHWADVAYAGMFSRYRKLPWFHQLDHAPLMPWKCVEVCPMGYIVFVSACGTEFKYLNRPVIVAGDVIE